MRPDRGQGRLCSMAQDVVTVAAPWSVLVVSADARLAPLLEGVDASALDDRRDAAPQRTPSAFVRGPVSANRRR